MTFSGPYFANFIRRNKPSMVGHYGVAPFPCAKGPPGTQTMGDVDLLLIPRHARHVKAAMTALAFFIRPSNIEDLDDLHCKVSPLLHFSRSFIRRNPNPYITVFENMMLHQHVALSPPSPIWKRVNSQLTVMAQRIWLGASVARSLAYTQHLVNGWVRTSKRMAALRSKEHP
jgi:spermidine/putrescine-binding protein